MQRKGQAQSTASVGRRSELLAQAALIANGYSVLEPSFPEAYDIAVTRRGDETMSRIQVKTILKRQRNGVNWFVIRGTKNSGRVYDKDDCDYFIGVYDDVIYMTPNREISEYWAREDEADVKWERLN